MSFTSFSKEFTANMFTSVENQFITKYLPQADGDAVRVYLYGLYLCQCKEEFDADGVAKLLKIPCGCLLEIYSFWEECDLVHILSRDPLLVEYLPVNAAIGKPKSVRPEKYAEFNRSLYRHLQQAQKDFKPYEIQRILEFLENNPMEQQAFLLVFEYCAKKDGEKLTCRHILNKAKKLCDEHKYTYEQVEREFSDFNANERELLKIFALLGIYRKPQDADYGYFSKWISAGMETGAIFACAQSLKKGSVSTLDSLVTELCGKEIRTESEAREYLAHREELVSLVFKTAKRLGVKVENPRTYAEEYAEKWTERGYDEESLLLIAAVCFKLRYAFPEMDAMVDELYRDGIVDVGSVRAYCSERDGELKLIQKIQSVCGVVKKTQSVLDTVGVWRSWNFSDAMILEAAKRSANASAPLPYMNKLLSEWKRIGAFTPSEIPEQPPRASAPSDFRSEAAIAADSRGERERYYAALRHKAQERANHILELAEQDEEYRTATAALRKGEIELARAEVYSPEKIEDLRAALGKAAEKRKRALARLDLSEDDLLPKYRCEKCSDSGFLPDGRLCDCYKGE